MLQICNFFSQQVNLRLRALNDGRWRSGPRGLGGIGTRWWCLNANGVPRQAFAAKHLHEINAISIKQCRLNHTVLVPDISGFQSWLPEMHFLIEVSGDLKSRALLALRLWSLPEANCFFGKSGSFDCSAGPSWSLRVSNNADADFLPLGANSVHQKCHLKCVNNTAINRGRSSRSYINTYKRIHHYSQLTKSVPILGHRAA